MTVCQRDAKILCIILYRVLETRTILDAMISYYLLLMLFVSNTGQPMMAASMCGYTNVTFNISPTKNIALVQGSQLFHSCKSDPLYHSSCPFNLTWMFDLGVSYFMSCALVPDQSSLQEFIFDYFSHYFYVKKILN